MKPRHSLLMRQLKREFGQEHTIPAQWEALLHRVDEAYQEFDADRAMLEHALELSSQELLDANAEMRAVFQAIPDLVFRLDHAGAILDVKAGAAGELMLERRDSIGKRLEDTPLREVAPQFSDAIQRVIAGNAPVIIEYSAVLQGQESSYEARLMPLPEQQIVVIVRNITERKQLLRLLGAAVEQSAEAIVITDTELDLPGPRFLFVNPAFTRMTGYSAAEAIGNTPRILQGPASDRATLRRLRETLSRGETFAGETVNYRKDGTTFDLEWQVTPLRNSSGAITHFLGLQRDITQRRRTEKALRESEARYRTLFESSSDGIVMVDIETNAFKYANPALCRMLGYAEEELCIMSVRDVHPKDAVQRVVAEFEAQARGEKKLSTDIPCLRKDGSVFPADIIATQIMLGDRPCNVGFFRDITARKQAEFELEQTHAQLVAVSRQAGMAEFATGILHNVSNVLNSVNVASTCVAAALRKSKSTNLTKVVALLHEHENDLGAFLTNDPTGRLIPSYLADLAGQLTGEQAVALEELAQLQRNIEHIKDIVTTQQGLARTSRATETVNVTELVKAALSINASGLAGHDIEVTEARDDLPPVMVEKNKALQILVNLISNARHSCDASGRQEKKLSVHTTGQDGHVCIAVTDNGVGIPAENLPCIFAHGFTTKKDGHGFGLHSAALAAKELGGSLSVRSDGAGLGATFTLELPCEPVASTHEDRVR